MTAVRWRYVLAMGVCAFVASVTAQITFSRDWTGGKRTAPQTGLDCSQFTRLCRHFVHELKQRMMPTKHHREEPDKSFLYDDD